MKKLILLYILFFSFNFFAQRGSFVDAYEYSEGDSNGDKGTSLTTQWILFIAIIIGVIIYNKTSKKK
jgi:hypothetical protein